MNLIISANFKDCKRTFNNLSEFYVCLFDVKLPEHGMKKNELYMKVYFEYLCTC